MRECVNALMREFAKKQKFKSTETQMCEINHIFVSI